MFGFIPRSLAVVGIVGVLSFGMPVAAEADTGTLLGLVAVAGTSGAGGAVAGVGVEAAAPEVIAGTGFACAATLPLCAAVAAATVGVALYATQDTWVPWLKGAFGSSTNQTPTGSYLLQPGWGRQTLQWVVPPSGSAPLQYRVTSISGTDASGGILSEATCLRPDGSVYARNPTWAQVAVVHWVTNNFTGINFSDVGCAAGEVIQSAAISSHWSDNYQIVIAQSLMWGGGVGAGNTTTSAQVDCVNPDGSTYSVTSAVPLAGDLVKIPTCTGAVGDLGGAHGKCVTLSAGATGGAMVQQSSNCGAAAGSSALYPNCVGAGVACTYVVQVDGKACTVGAPGCTNWSKLYAEDPSRVGCRWGLYAVPVSACSFLERVYEAVGTPVPATLANTDGDPATSTGTAPAPGATPQPIPPGAPGGAPGTLPGGGTGTLPSPGSNPQTNADCWSGGSFSWNPVDWVLTPIKCGLSWAFVPRTATLSTLATTTKTDLTAQGIGPMVTAVNANMSKVGGNGSGCAGPSVTFAAVGITKALTPFNACTAPMSTLASISYYMTTIVVVLGGGFAAVKAVGAGFGFNFSMRRAGGGDAA